jgi:hypothetical protein
MVNFWFCGRRIELLDGDGLVQMMPFHSSAIFRNCYQSVPLNSERIRNGSKKIDLEYFFTISYYMLVKHTWHVHNVSYYVCCLLILISEDHFYKREL